MRAARGGWIWCAVGLAACAVDAGPVPGPDPAAGRHGIYVGSVEGADAVVAFSVDEVDGTVNSYVCGGAATYATLSRWFCGDSARDRDSRLFEKTEEHWHMSAVVRADRVEGSFEGLNGTVYRFVAPRRAPGSHADLYGHGGAGGCTTGAIVVHDDPVLEPIVVGTSCEERSGGDRRYDQVTPLLPHDFGQELLQVSVPDPEGERYLLLRRLRP